MFIVRRVVIVLIMGALMAGSASAQTAKENIALSLKQFTDLALQNSLRSRTAEENLAFNRYGWLAARRNLTWPTLSAAASGAKTYADNDAGTTVDTRDNEASLSLKQPLLTGTNLSVDSTWTRIRTETNALGIVTPSQTRYQPVVSAGFTQPIFIFTGNESLRARREANIAWDNDQDAYWSERLAIEFEARTRYYDLLLQSETAAVQRKKLESSTLVHDTTRALVRAGKLAQVELVRADIRARTDQRAIQNAETNLEQSMNSARDLISLPNNQEIRLTSVLEYRPFSITLERLKKAAVDNNPDLQTAKRQIELAQIALKRSRETDHPQLNTSGSYALTRDRSNDLAPLDPYTWNVKVGVDWPIFNASQSQLRKRQSEITVQNTKRAYENALRQLLVSVENTYLEIKRTEDQISDFTPQREAAGRNVHAIRLQYRNGLTRLTDVFDAENQMRDLDLEYLGLLVTFNTARDRLKVLVGTDLDNLNGAKRTQ